MFNIFTKEGIIEFLYILPALLISLAIHEFAHAYTAYKLGDKSQKALGRLTLHPFSHIDWFGFISIALIGFGWGKPVMVDDRNFKNRTRDNMLVALAGPMSNLLLAVIITLIFKICMMAGLVNINTVFTSTIGVMLINTISFNIIFSVFNMLPLPPFDGSKVLLYFLPNRFKNFIYVLERYSFYIIILLLLSDIHIYLISPIINFIGNILLAILSL